MTDLLIGADPEGFFFDTVSHGFVSAAGKIPGSKDDPHPVDKGALQVDGMAWEYNIEPASTAKEFVMNNKAVQSSLKEYAGDRLQLVFEPTCTFPKKVWDSASEKELELGCDPDYNAYTGRQNPVPDHKEKFRSASGHIHIGWTKDMDILDEGHFEACCMLAKQLDVALGVPSLLMEQSKGGMDRRKLYGKAGAFRPKPYGMEYRVLSNFWAADEELMDWVFNTSIKAFKDLLDGDMYYDDQSPKQQELIDNIDKEGLVKRKRCITLSGLSYDVIGNLPKSLREELRGEVEDVSKLKWLTEDEYETIASGADLPWVKFCNDYYGITVEEIKEWGLLS